MKALESAFNQEKAEVVAYSVIVKLHTSRRFVSSSTRQRVIATLGRTGGLHLVLIQGADWHMWISRS